MNAQKAGGTTNIKKGVAWGHRVLSPDAPCSESGAGKTANLGRIMIVLTDGANVFGNAPIRATAISSTAASASRRTPRRRRG